MSLYFYRSSQNAISGGGPTNKRPATHLASSNSGARDEPDYTNYELQSGLSLSRGHSFDLITLLDRLHQDIGSIVLFSGKELEILSEFDPDEMTYKYDLPFLLQIKEAADRHLTEKREIRDALGLLKIYHNSARSASSSNNTDAKHKQSGSSSDAKHKQSTTSPSKRSRRGDRAGGNSEAAGAGPSSSTTGRGGNKK